MNTEAAKRRAAILRQVESIVCADRNMQHGDAEDTFPAIAEMWNAYINRCTKPKGYITGLDVANMMALFKMIRQTTNPAHFDSSLDLVGYAACSAGIAKGAYCDNTTDTCRSSAELSGIDSAQARSR